MSSLDLAVALTCAGCYLLKLSGMFVPPAWLAERHVRAIAVLLPVALLSALTAVQVFASGKELVIDARVAGIAVAVVCLLLRAPFIVVVVAAAATAALLRAVV